MQIEYDDEHMSIGSPGCVRAHSGADGSVLLVARADARGDKLGYSLDRVGGVEGDAVGRVDRRTYSR